MKTAILFSVVSLFFLTNCGQQKDNESKVESEKKSQLTNELCDRDFGGNESAVDLSDLLKIYEEYMAVEGKKIETAEADLWETLGGEILETCDRIYLFEDNSFAVHLPQYANSESAFLANAEFLYNSCAFAFNLWSNYEVWLRQGLVEPKEVVAACKKINPDCIKDVTVRNAAKAYQDSLIRVMEMFPEDDEVHSHSFDFLLAFVGVISEKINTYYVLDEDLQEYCSEMYYKFKDLTASKFESYTNMSEKRRLKWMLESLNECGTFAEQCSLFLNWADCKESKEDDLWIIAVAHRLMQSGNYSLFLNRIWMIWRCLSQAVYWGGQSRDAAIPNDYYNEMRKQSYLTCLKWIEKNPSDILCKVCAGTIAGRINMNRYGSFMFGNQAMEEMMYALPNRYE